MIDYFAVLGQPRRPWLDPEKLKEQHQALTLAEHPDRKELRNNAPPSRGAKAAPTLPAATFAEINEAFRVLSSPRTRLQHLLGLEGNPKSAAGAVSNDLLELFTQIATLLTDSERL